MLQDTLPQTEANTQILHPGSRRLFSHWESLRAERAYPTREEFTFEPIKDLLPDLLILDRDHLRNSYRYRLAGSRVCGMFGKNLTSSDALSNWESFEKNIIAKQLNAAFVQFQPSLIRMRLTTDTGQIVAVEFIALPIQLRGSDRMQLVGGMFAFRDSRNLGHSAIVAQELASARMIWTEFSIAPDSHLRSAPLPVDFTGKLRVIAGGKA